MKWQLQEAKARFSEFLEAAIKKGPQIVTRRGVETAVLVPIDEWKRLQKNAKTTMLDVLTGPGPQWDDDFIPPRGRLKRRPSPDFS